MRKYLFPVAVVLAWSLAQAALSAFDEPSSPVTVPSARDDGGARDAPSRPAT
jgi:hypothetical protein